MRKLTSMTKSGFTTELLDVVVNSDSEDHDDVFIVMEYLDFDIKKLLYNTKSFEFSEEHVVIIMYNSLCALKLLHSANIMHRDIKPANILVTDQCEVKICDFGLSRTVPSNHVNPENLNIQAKCSRES